MINKSTGIYMYLKIMFLGHCIQLWWIVLRFCSGGLGTKGLLNLIQILFLQAATLILEIKIRHLLYYQGTEIIAWEYEVESFILNGRVH